MQRMYWINNRHREFLVNHLKNGLIRWQKKWCTESSICDVRVDDDTLCESSISDAALPINLCVTDEMGNCVETFVASQIDPKSRLPRDDVFAELLYRAAAELRELFCLQSSQLAARSNSDRASRWDALIVTIKMGESSLSLLLSIDAFASLLFGDDQQTFGSVDGNTLVPWRKAIGDTLGDFVVRLPLGKKSMFELLNLAQGQVVCFDLELDHHFQLTTPDGKAMLAGFLGRQGNKKAFQTVVNIAE